MTPEERAEQVEIVSSLVGDPRDPQRYIDYSATEKNIAEAIRAAEAPLQEKIERLKRGDFTEDEFQNLCHNLSADDERRFRAGCEAYQRKLFHPADPCVVSWDNPPGDIKTAVRALNEKIREEA